MADSTKRSLRVRKPPVYLSPDNQDQQPAGYIRQPYTKEYVSPAQQLNTIAKLLSKFVNSVNKNLRQATKNQLTNTKKSSIQNASNVQKQPKRSDVLTQTEKKKGVVKEQPKIQGQKQVKNLYGTKEQNLTKQHTKGQEINNKSNDKSSNQKKNYPSLNNNLTNSNYLNLINKLGQQKFAPFPNFKNSELNQIILQQQQAIHQNLSNRTKWIPVQRYQNQPRNSISQNRQKLFGRSSYHVAIAYHIHLKNLQDKNIDLNFQQQVDPTFKAKMLKGNYQGGSQDNLP